MTKKYHVQLSETDREDLQKLMRKGKIAVRRLKRAQILLAADSGLTDERIASTIQVHVNTVERIRKRFVEGGCTGSLD